MTGTRASRVPRDFLGIEPGERSLVTLLFAQYFFTGTASGLTQTAGFALQKPMPVLPRPCCETCSPTRSLPSGVPPCVPPVAAAIRNSGRP